MKFPADRRIVLIFAALCDSAGRGRRIKIGWQLMSLSPCRPELSRI